MDTIIDIPDESVAPEESEVSEISGRKNFANKKKTVAKVLERAKAAIRKYQSQHKRTEFENMCKEADEMLRLAKDQTKQAENKTSDDMDTIPDIFLQVHRAITANETEIIINPTDAPGTYEPLEKLDSISREDVLKNCKDQDLILEYSRVMDKRKTKEEEAFWKLNKYGTIMLGMEWYEREWKTKERRPAAQQSEDPDDPVAYDWHEATQSEAFPMMTAYDMKDVFIDAMIPDIQQQTIFALRDYPMLEDVFAEQAKGEYMNAGKIKSQHYYRLALPDDIKADRAENAGDAGDENEVTGQLDRWHVWIRAPINEDTGKWDSAKNRSKWWLATFAGNVDQIDDPVCLRLIRNPYWWNKDQVPNLLWHSHMDDNGAYCAGYAKHIRPAYMELKTTLDQWFYNKNLINAAPYVTEFGAIFNDAKDFGPHSLLVMHQGQMDKLKRLEIPSITNDMQIFIGYLENRIQRTGGTNDAYMGEAMGSRTSATEADRAYMQARKPGLMALRFKASQVYPWMAEWDSQMWRHYADSALTIALTRNGNIEELKPATVWGPMRYKVIAVDEYERTTVARHENDRFLQTTLPVYSQVAGKKLTMKMLAHIYVKERKYPAELFPESSDKDARHVARNENEHFVAGVWNDPLDGQDHDIHLDEHETFLIIYKALADARDDVIQMLESHIAMTKAMQQQEAAGLAQSATQTAEAVQGIGAAETAPMTTGQVNGDTLGAAGGGMMA